MAKAIILKLRTTETKQLIDVLNNGDAAAIVNCLRTVELSGVAAEEVTASLSPSRRDYLAGIMECLRFFLDGGLERKART